jgi:hypothetical protein
MYLIGGILRRSQAIFYGLAFFWSGGFADSAPTQAAQTTRRRAKIGVTPDRE